MGAHELVVTPSSPGCRMSWAWPCKAHAPTAPALWA